MAIPSPRLAAAVALAAATAAVPPSLAPPASAPPPSSSPAATPVGPTLTVVATDYAFRAPATVGAGRVVVRLVNRGWFTHHVVVSRLGDTTSLGTFLRAVTTPGLGEAFRDVGGPAMAAPGRTTEAEILLEPGRYALSCWVTGADGRPHVRNGMMALLTVLPRGGMGGVGTAARGAAERASDLGLRASDYHFEFAGSLAHGRRWVRFENDGPQEHDVQVVRLGPATQVADVVAWARAGLVDAPPGVALVGGASGINPGERVRFPLDLVPGRYAMFCFVPDAKDERPHILHGMVRGFVVR